MSYAIVRKLLETKLNDLSPGFATAFENVAFNPSNGTPWQAAVLLPAKTENPTMGDGFKREIGIFQIMLNYPINQGSQVAQARANTLINGFPRGLTLSQGTLRVLVDEHPFQGKSIPNPSWYQIPISIPYVVDVFS